MAARRSLAAWKQRALRELRASRRETLAVIDRLPREALMEPRTQDRWSVKDVLGHFMACDEETARRFRHIAAGHPERIKWFESLAYADRFNARTVAAARRLGLPTVLRRMAKARAEMVHLFQRFTPDVLSDPSHAYPVVDWLPAPGWSHEREHMAGVKAWWRARSR
jgi:DinB family protein